jgi:hypothetical protein
MLERWRAAPAEGVHSDEVWHALAYPNFESAQIVASAAVILLILHLAPSPWSALTHPRSGMSVSSKRFWKTLPRIMLYRKFDCKEQIHARKNSSCEGLSPKTFDFDWWS